MDVPPSDDETEQNEIARLDALYDYAILDTPPEDLFDDFTRLAAYICGTPISLLTLLDETRQWFKAGVGIALKETPREIALCGYTILQKEVLIVPDVLEDARFVDNPLVTGWPHIRFYAGAPLITPDGYALGTLCAIDRVPRTLTPEQQEALQILSRKVIAELELRRSLKEQKRLVASLQQTQHRLQTSEQQFEAFMNNCPAASWITDDNARIVYLSERYTQMFGVTAADSVGKTSFELYPLKYAQSYYDNIREVAETHQTIERVERATRPDGSEGEYLVYKFPIPSESARNLIGGMAVDITEQRKTQSSLRLLETAIQQARESIMITTAELDVPGPQIVFVNPGFTRITGYECDEVLGKNPSFLQGAQTDREVLDSLRAALREGRVFDGEVINYRKDGTAFWMEWEISPLHSDTGAITHFVATQREVTERHEHQKQRQRQFERMTALRAIDVSILHNRDLHFTLGLVLDQIRILLGVEAVAILLMNHDSQSLEYAVRRGFRNVLLSTEPGWKENEPALLAFQEGQPITLLNLQDDGVAFLDQWRTVGETFVDYQAIPIIANNVPQGVLELFHREINHPDVEWREFLEALIGQAAIAVDNAAMFGNLGRANQELLASHDATIMGWSRALDLRDKETEGHSERVTEMTERLAQSMGIEGDALLQIRRGALLHDVGKLGIPDNILLKPGPLTEEEWKIMRQHPTYAYEMLYPILFLRPALDIPFCHHEKWDGTGYPNELRGEMIPLAARIFAIADVYDALRSDRPYRAGWPIDRIREHIQRLSGIHFDPVVVEAFLNFKL